MMESLFAVSLCGNSRFTVQIPEIFISRANYVTTACDLDYRCWASHVAGS